MNSSICKSCFLLLVSCLLVGCQTTTKVQENPEIELSQNLLSRITPESNREYSEIEVDGQVLNVEKADTPQKIETGLSYREEIGADGMLFYIPRRSVPSFWMKGMLMDLDMIWMDCEYQNAEYGIDNIDNVFDELVGKTAVIDRNECLIVDVSRNVPKSDDPTLEFNNTIRSPKVPVTHVLEIISQ